MRKMLSKDGQRKIGLFWLAADLFPLSSSVRHFFILLRMRQLFCDQGASCCLLPLGAQGQREEILSASVQKMSTVCPTKV